MDDTSPHSPDCGSPPTTPAFWQPRLLRKNTPAWEAHYHGRIGQPPIHPKVLAGLLLYGMRHAVRSSRRLEYMAGHAIDFIWLVEGRRPDHSTICEFRTKFGQELKDLFRNVVKMALEGGYAVNYNPVAAAEGHGGYIVHADVLNTVNEHDALVPAIDDVVATFGQAPAAVGADTAFSTGDNIARLEARKVEFLSPLPEAAARGPNPAIRSDPTQPVPESEWNNLPVNPQHKMLDRTCFVYDSERDVYHCPQGRELPFEQTKTDTTHGKKIELDLYRSASCEGCPLKGRCVHPRNRSGARTISRDVHTETRERHAAKMKLPESQEKYSHRMHGAETPFAYIKHVLGLRQFLLRGLEKVKLEWLWACLASNVWKLVRDMRGLRAQQRPTTIEMGVE